MNQLGPDVAGTIRPRRGDEPLFQDLWEARAFGLVMALHEDGRFVWTEFRDRLIAEIAAAESARPEEDSGEHYYERWLAALERLLHEKAIVDAHEVAARVGAAGAAQPD